MSADLFEAFGGSSKPEPASPAPGQRAVAPKRQDTGLIYARKTEPQQIRHLDEPLWKADEGGNDVLFDAADEPTQSAADDDFGDFEDVEQSTSVPLQVADKVEVAPGPRQGQQESTLIDLLSLEDASQPDQPSASEPAFTNDWLADHPSIHGVDPQTSTTTQLPQPPDDDDAWGEFEDVSRATPKQTPTKPTPTVIRATKSPAPLKKKTLSPPEGLPDDDWDAFEDGEPPPPTNPQSNTKSATNPPNDLLSDPFPHPSPAATHHTPSTPTAFPSSPTRPTNIPPPSTLLYLLTTIYTTLTSPPPSSIIHLYHATAAITAARTHRWRRDTLLSQSTRIAAATATKSGMKLSSLNKSETAREEREAQETVDAWNARAGRWWALVKDEEGVKGRKGGLRLQLPLGVRVVGPREGGMEAAYACPVCGMKRSERVVGVDDGVEDVFGEFWVEGWGHRSCGEVWYGWKGLLGQR